VHPGWPAHPVIYEINTWPWLAELGRRDGRSVTLADVPADAWDHLGELAIDAVWLMGVWERSPAGTQMKRNDERLRREGQDLLRGFTPGDIVGSPYCVRRYVPDARLGGAGGLGTAREQLASRGLKLLLDFVPNHVAPDHAWVSQQPECLIPGEEEDLARRPHDFTKVNGNVVARGRDRYTVWADVLQLKTFHPAVRRAAVETVGVLAELCDGVRCDMAMLVLNDVVADLWGERAGPVPSEEYWPPVIETTRARHPEFLFVAEAYWDLEDELLRQGFDYCYDKRLYDRIVSADVDGIRDHLRGADCSFQSRLVRFTENHDEERAAARLSAAQSRAAAVAVGTLPGATLWHQGQFEGRRVKAPIELGRWPEEDVDAESAEFYRVLTAAARHVRHGRWELCDVSGWPDNDTCRNIVAWSWQGRDEATLVVVNVGSGPAQARVAVPVRPTPQESCMLVDVLTHERFTRDTRELRDQGLYVDLPPGAFHVLGGHF
jgi:Alpha amylase, catalytic domain